MSNVTYYCLHDILKFKIATNNKFNLLKDINFFFSYFESKPHIDSDIILNIGRFAPSNENCTLVDHKYFIKENYFYCRDSDGRAKWEVEIFGFDHGKVRINFHSKILGIEQILFPDYLAQNIILRPLIEIKLLEKGYISIHGLGIEKEGDAYILAARGGAHKTRIAMDIMKNREYKLIGDDRVILSKDGYVFSYPLFFNLVRFRADNMNEEHISLFSDKIKMIRYLNSKSCDRNSMEIITNKSKLKKIFLVARKNKQIDSKISELNAKEITERIVNSNRMEMLSSGISSSLGFIPLLRYMQAYSYVFPTSSISQYWLNLQYSIQSIVEKVSVHEVTFPMYYDNSILSKLI